MYNSVNCDTTSFELSNNFKKNKRLWWLSPYSCVFFLLLILVISYFKNESYYQMYNVNKYVNTSYLLIVISLLLLFSIGVFISSKLKNDFKMNCINNDSSIKKFTYFLFFMVMFGYGVWFFNFVRIYGLSFNLNLSIYHNDSGRIEGITSCTQFAIVVVPCLLYLIKKKSSKIIPIIMLVIIFLLSLIRAYLFSERLALIEVSVAFLLTYVVLFSKRKIIALFPFLGLIIVFAIFSLFESFRSWSYYSYYYDSYFDFIYDRFTAYYSMAINTNSMFVQKTNNLNFPYFTFNFLNKVPGIGKTNMFSLLEEYGNVEYNNPGALASFYLDFGFLGFPLSLLTGFFVGNIYHKIKNGNIFYLAFYCILFLSLIELPRYFYVGNSRAFYPLISIIVLYFISKGKLILTIQN